MLNKLRAKAFRLLHNPDVYDAATVAVTTSLVVGVILLISRIKSNKNTSV